MEILTGGTEHAELSTQSRGSIPAAVNGYSARLLNKNPTKPFREFTLAPDASYSYVVDSLRLGAGVQSNQNGTTSWDYHVFWGVAGFSVLLGTLDGPSTTSPDARPVTSVGLGVSLFSLPSQTCAVSFRIAPNRVSGTN